VNVGLHPFQVPNERITSQGAQSKSAAHREHGEYQQVQKNFCAFYGVQHGTQNVN
tara:strand:- start:4998 stop:5162 length:165 start_codon:yes stop_codon:yes gene_type:complete